jgi:transcriptional regulator with XRE-family HTH domain
VLALSVLDRSPSPGYITTLREALGYTQKQLAEKLGIDKMTVSRWERGALRPSGESLKALEKLRRKSARAGVVILG